MEEGWNSWQRELYSRSGWKRFSRGEKALYGFSPMVLHLEGSLLSLENDTRIAGHGVGTNISQTLNVLLLNEI